MSAKLPPAMAHRIAAMMTALAAEHCTTLWLDPGEPSDASQAMFSFSADALVDYTMAALRAMAELAQESRGGKDTPTPS